MVYCSNCGEKISDDANFCPKCGKKTALGSKSNVSYPSTELEDAFYKVGIELERAFTIAARETREAIKQARENKQEKTQPETTSDVVVCPKCSTKNTAGAVFCNNCGTRITPLESSGSV